MQPLDSFHKPRIWRQRVSNELSSLQMQWQLADWSTRSTRWFRWWPAKGRESHQEKLCLWWMAAWAHTVVCLVLTAEKLGGTVTPFTAKYQSTSSDCKRYRSSSAPTFARCDEDLTPLCVRVPWTAGTRWQETVCQQGLSYWSVCISLVVSYKDFGGSYNQTLFWLSRFLGEKIVLPDSSEGGVLT